MQSKTSKRRKQNGKRKGRLNTLLADGNNEWASLTPKSLWIQLRSELKAYYDWELKTDNIDSTVETYALQKISLLR